SDVTDSLRLAGKHALGEGQGHESTRKHKGYSGPPFPAQKVQDYERPASDDQHPCHKRHDLNSVRVGKPSHQVVSDTTADIVVVRSLQILARQGKWYRVVSFRDSTSPSE